MAKNEWILSGQKRQTISVSIAQGLSILKGDILFDLMDAAGSTFQISGTVLMAYLTSSSTLMFTTSLIIVPGSFDIQDNFLSEQVLG